MTKKIEHLTTQLQESFPEIDAKKLSKKLGELSEIYEAFVPDKIYKETLRTRLENIHSMQKSSRPSYYNFLKFSGLFASFLFVSGVSYFYYTSQQTVLNQGIQTQMEQASFSSDISSQNIGGDDMTDVPQYQTENKTQNISSQSIALDTNGETFKGEESSQGAQSPVQKRSLPQDMQDKTQLNQAQNIGDVSLDTQMSLPENVSGNIPQQDEKSDTQNTNSDEYIISEILTEYGDLVPDSHDINALPKEVLPNSIMLEGTMRMMSDTLDLFYEICSSYSGSVLEDDFTCQFTQTDFCTRENIFPESEKRCEYLKDFK